MLKNNLKLIPKSIWALGFTSMFMDLSSELTHAVLPLFMVGSLGASMTSVGLIEGLSEAVALITKIFSGTISDLMGKRKLLTVIGYGLSAFTKPLFPMADSITTVFVARFSDRIGKGIRGAPRDALVGDIAPAEIRGECFGLRQMLDTIGAFLAPLAAIVLLMTFTEDLRMVMWIAVIPAAICMVILILGVEEPKNLVSKRKTGFPLKKENIKKLTKPFWIVVISASFLTMARFSDAFMLLKARDVGLSIGWIPVVLVVMNFVYALSAYPVGIISDRIPREKILIAGVVILIVANSILAYANSIWLVMLGTAIWGLHMGVTQGLLAAMVTDRAPAELRGTAYGLFNLFCGIAMLIASVSGGALWDHFGAKATFVSGVGFAVIALIFLKKPVKS
jgi:MFS family permease